MRRYQTLFLIVFALIGLDQWTKYLAVTYLHHPKRPMMEQCRAQRDRCEADCLPQVQRKGGALKHCLKTCKTKEDVCRNGYKEVKVRWQQDLATLKSSTLCSRVRHWYESDAQCEVIRGHFGFSYQINPGAAWSLFRDTPQSFRRPFFIVITTFAIFFILYLFFFQLEAGQRWLGVALASILGGAMGNFIDRLRLNYVIDFIDWHIHYGKLIHFFNSGYDATRVYRFPTFNVADIGITIGVAMIAWELLTTPLEDPNATEDLEESDRSDDPSHAPLPKPAEPIKDATSTSIETEMKVEESAEPTSKVDSKPDQASASEAPKAS